MAREMTVEGRAELSLAPDCIRVELRPETLCKEYAAAVETQNAVVSTLQKALLAAGLRQEAVTLADFSIRAEYHSHRPPDGNCEENFVGYRCSQLLRVKMACEATLLGKVLAALTECAACPQLSVQFTVEHPEEVRDQLIAKAVADARHKAKILVQAAGCTLGELLRMEYGGETPSLYSPTRYALESGGLCRAAMPEIAPEAITVSDTVRMVWALS